MLFLTACRDEAKSKAQIQQAIVDRLQQHSGLDLNAIDINTTDVKFDKNTAAATVSFHPKGDNTVNGGMTMTYALEERDGKWVVTGVKGMNGMPGHPSTAGPLNGTGTGEMPPGHPQIPQTQKQ